MSDKMEAPAENLGDRYPVIVGRTKAVLKGSEKKNYLGFSRYRAAHTVMGILTVEDWAKLYPDRPPTFD